LLGYVLKPFHKVIIEAYLSTEYSVVHIPQKLRMALEKGKRRNATDPRSGNSNVLARPSITPVSTSLIFYQSHPAAPDPNNPDTSLSRMNLREL